MNVTNSNTQAPAAPELQLPPDPDGLNDERAKWAQTALNAFVIETGADPEDALADLISDLMHLAPRLGLDFKDEFDRASRNYTGETTYEPDANSSEEDDLRRFSVLVARKGASTLVYPEFAASKTLALMKRLSERGHVPIARTTANGITEDVTLAQMQDLYGL